MSTKFALLATYAFCGLTLLGLLFWFIYGAWQRALLVDCKSNMRRLAAAISCYKNDLNVYPTGEFVPKKGRFQVSFGWPSSLLNYLSSYRLSEHPLHQKTVSLHEGFTQYQFARFHFQCPAASVTKEQQSLLNHYLGLTGVGPDSADYPIEHPDAGFFGRSRKIRFSDIQTKGSASLLIIHETDKPEGYWYQPGPPTVRGIPAENYADFGGTSPFGSAHSRYGQPTANALFLDGRVVTLKRSVDPHIVRELVRINSPAAAPVNWEE